MLAVTVRAGSHGLECAPRPKGCNGPPLCESSAHPKHTHASWVKSSCRSFGNWSTLKCDEDDAINQLKIRLQGNFASQHIVAACEASRRNPSCVQGAVRDTVWLVLDFHPIFERAGIGRKLREFSSCPWWQEAYFHAFNASPPRVRVAWKSAGMSTAQTFQALNKVAYA